MQIPVTGMSCQSCAEKIESSVARLPGAKNVSVNFALKQLTYEGLEPDIVVKTLRSLGYDSPEVSGVFQTQNIEELGQLETRLALREFLLACVGGIPLFLTNMIFEEWALPPWWQACLAVLVVFIAGASIHKRTWNHLLNGTLSMDTLVTVGSVAALVQSFLLLLRGTHAHGFESASTIVMFVLLGKYLEARVR
jgi:Cu+-exporting ATPase